ncbi:Glyco_trans_2-like domain-containing protein [Gammaproteobacteria bacterium]
MRIPYFSIIIPTHNRPQLLRRAILSLRESSFDDYEIIVISDERAVVFNEISELLQSRDTFLKRSGPPGPAESRNQGLRIARGHYVMFLDDDDAFLPNYLYDLYIARQQGSQNIFYTNFRIVEENRNSSEGILKTIDYSVAQVESTLVYVKNFIHPGTLSFPRVSLLNRYQDLSLKSLEDWDFLLNVLQGSSLEYKNILGAVIYKDYFNFGTRRGNCEQAEDILAASDYLTIYKKWPAPTEELKNERKKLLASGGINVPLVWL